MMLLEIDRQEIKQLVATQLKNLFLYEESRDGSALEKGIATALQLCEKSFSQIALSYYTQNGQTYFNPFQTAQYGCFLYYLSSAVAKDSPDNSRLADTIFALNKALHGFDAYHQVGLPDIFFCDHPVGTVLGRADYSDYFSFGQRCTIGNNKGKHPSLGKYLTMGPGATILGDCTIGDHVTVSVNACIKDTDIPSNSVVFGTSPDLVIKKYPIDYHPFKDPNN